mmetsp:Transcript_21443/g.56666  ORF Transcript_21443/g.56666 Transcript_21443/m.56666 type:complete len:201 (-) Transcript_21443:17-619(-)
MGSIASRLEEKQRSAAIEGKLVDLRQAMRVRDMEVAMRIAATRDRLCWLAAYYSLVLSFAGARHASMHRRGVPMHFDNFFLPLPIAFTLMPPVLFMYQLDFALQPTSVFGFRIGGKANRLAEEANRIREGVRHCWFGHPWLPEVDDGELWIHRPVCLPLAFEEAYRRQRAQGAALRAARGLAPAAEPHWAYFAELCRQDE